MKLGICPIAVGDGIGEEDFDEEEGDEADDERDPAAEDAGSNKPRQRRPPPVWLAEAFKPRLPDANQRDANGLPKLYAVNQTFWFLQPSTYFFDNPSFHRLFSTIPVFSRGIQQFFALTEFLALSANTDVPPLPYLPAMTVCGFRGKHFG